MSEHDADHWRRLGEGEFISLCLKLGLSDSMAAVEQAKRVTLDGKGTVSEIEFVLGDTIGKKEAGALGETGIFTLRDARNKLIGGGAPDPDSSYGERLHSLARFTAISADTRLTGAIYDDGARSIGDVAALSAQGLANLASKTTLPLESFEAVRENAKQVKVQLNLAITARYASRGQPGGLITTVFPPEKALGDSLLGREITVDGAARKTCGDCDPCASAFSKAAYMLDLINSIGVRFGLDVAELDAKLHRRFQTLKADCDDPAQKVPRLVICNEVLERYAIAERSELNDVADIHAALTARSNADYAAFLMELFVGLAGEIGVSASQLRGFITRLGADTSAPGFDSVAHERALGALRRQLGLRAGGDDYPGMPGVGSVADVENEFDQIDPDALDLPAVARFEALLAPIQTRQLYQRWRHEDEILAEAPPPSLIEQRQSEYDAMLFHLPGRIQAIRHRSSASYHRALDDAGVMPADGVSEAERHARLFLNCGSGECEEMSRLHEATLALQRFFEDLILSHDDTDRPVRPADWEKFSSYPTWRGRMLFEIYPELFYDQFDLADDVAAMGHHPDDRLYLDEIERITAALNSTAYHDPDALAERLTAVHRKVWAKLPPEWRIYPFLDDFVIARQRQMHRELMAIASDPATIVQLDVCEWVYLQRSTLRMERHDQVFPGASQAMSRSFSDYDRRVAGTDGGSHLDFAHVHMLAFYVLPRLWGKFHHAAQNYDQAARFFHLIYNEGLVDYEIPERTFQGIFALTHVGPVVYEHLRRYPVGGFATFFLAGRTNRYDMEERDIRLLIARNYVDWADEEFRRNDPDGEGRERARDLYRRALGTLGHAEHGDDVHSCENPCTGLARHIERQILRDLDFAQFPGLASKWNEFVRRNDDPELYVAVREAMSRVHEGQANPGELAGALTAILEGHLTELPDEGLSGFVERGVDYADNGALVNDDRILAAWDHGIRDASFGNRVLGFDLSGPGGGSLVSFTPGPDGGEGEPPMPGLPGRDPGGDLFDPDKPLVDLPDIFDPKEDLVLHLREAICDQAPPPPPAFVSHGFCIPANPLARSIVQRSCLGLKLIAECRNFLGYRNDHVPLFRFEALIEMARELAGLAKSAENDFVSFIQSEEAQILTLLKETQALQVSQATVSLQMSMLAQADNNVTLSEFQIDRVTLQQDHTQAQLDEGYTDLEEEALKYLGYSRDLQIVAAALQAANLVVIPIAAAAGGAIGGFGGSFLGPQGTVAGGLGGAGFGAAAALIAAAPAVLGAGAGASTSLAGAASTHAQILQLKNTVEQRLDELGRTAELLEIDALVADVGLANAHIGVDIAEQQLDIARINATFAAEIVEFLQTKLFTGKRFAWMAAIAKENYRVLLNYTIAAAWLAEQALEFERQQRYDIIRFNYWRENDEGLMGVDQLTVDIEQLEHQHLVNEQRKRQITKVISFAQLSPIEMAGFRQTGQLHLSTLEEWFERDFPTHYLRLIKGVTVNIIALVPPGDGVKASLTMLGTTRTIVPNGAGYNRIEIKRPPERIAISSAVGATGVFTPLFPENSQLNPFEGSGIEASWHLEMDRRSNPSINYDTIMDVQFEIQYTALEDTAKQPQYPLIAKGAASFSLRQSFPDEFFHFQNPDLSGGAPATGPEPYTVAIESSDRNLAPNQQNRRPYAVTLLIESRSGEKKLPVVSLDFEPSTGGASLPVIVKQVPKESGMLRVDVDSLPTASGKWKLAFINDETDWLQAVKDHLDISGSVDPESDQLAVHNLFRWTDSTNPPERVPEAQGGTNLLELDWLADIQLMVEYDYKVRVGP